MFFYGIVLLNNVVYVFVYDDNGGIYKFIFNCDNGGLVENIVSNGGLFCNKVYSLISYNDNFFVFSDIGDLCIKVYDFIVKKCFVVVGNGKGIRDGSKV